MEKITKNKSSVKVRNPSDHMANERTFLAWIRTSIGIMAFGFVVEKFAFFMKNLSSFLGKSIAHESSTSSVGYSSIFGIVLVAFGALMGVLSFIRYKKVEREIDEETYRPSLLLDILITLLVIGMGAFFVVYMIYNI
jgi:putative membrane protein